MSGCDFKRYTIWVWDEKLKNWVFYIKLAKQLQGFANLNKNNIIKLVF